MHRAAVTITGGMSHAGMPSRKGAQANWNGDRKASTIWEIDNTTEIRNRLLSPEAR